MYRWALAIILIASTQFVGLARAITVDVTTPPQDGITITTQVDTDLKEISYTFDLNALPSDYNQIVFLPPMFPLDAIPFEASSVTAPGLTEWNLHGFWPGGTPSLELQFDHATPPPLLTTVTIVYSADYTFTGSFLGATGDDNIQVSMREPPVGGDDNVVLWAYYPEMVPTTPPASATLTGLRVRAGNQSSGGLPSLVALDDDYLVVDAALNGSGNLYLATAVIVAISSEKAISTLDVVMELAADSRSVRAVAWLRNFDTNQWDALGAFVMPLSDTQKAFFNVPGPNAYVDDNTGRIMLRLLTRARADRVPGGYALRVDQIAFEVMP